MGKPCKKLLQVLALSGAFACASGAVAAYAKNEVLYTDENVSLSAAVDRYIASGADVFECEVNTEIGTTVRYLNDTIEVSVEARAAETDEEDRYIYFTGKAVVVASDYVNMRQYADVESQLIATILPQAIVTVDEKGDEWSLVTSGECRGYIKNDFLKFGSDAADYAAANMTKKAYVTASALSLRAEKDENSECLATLPNGFGYEIIEHGDQWTYIKADSALNGYVKNDYIEIAYNMITASPVVAPDELDVEERTTETTEAASTTAAPMTTEAPTTAAPATTEAPSSTPSVSGSGTGSEIANFAVQYVGNPYVYGGTSLTNGADCSGFVMTVYSNFGYSLSRTAYYQSFEGTAVSQADIQPGDLVFYDYGTGEIQHVAIYIGNGQIVHAQNSSTGIVISSLNTPYTIRRIVN